MKNKRYLIPLLIVPTIMLSACKLFNFGSKKSTSITFHKYSNQVSYEQFSSSLQLMELMDFINDKLYNGDSFVFTHREITDRVNDFGNYTEKRYSAINETKSFDNNKIILETDYYSKGTYETPMHNSEIVKDYVEQLLSIGGGYYRVNETSKTYSQGNTINDEIFDISIKFNVITSAFLGASLTSKTYIDDKVYTLCYERKDDKKNNEKYICQIEQEKDQMDFRVQINSESGLSSDYNFTSEYTLELTINFTNPNLKPIDYQDFTFIK